MSVSSQRSRGATALWRRPFVSWSRSVAIGLPLVVTASLLVVPAQEAVAVERAAPRPACPVSRPDEAAALVTARLCKGRVQVEGATTESSLTWANPEGTLSTQMDGGPSRFQRDGKWVDIDADLKRDADGVVRAVAHPAGLDLFGGDTATTRAKTGDRALIKTVRSKGKGIALNWKGRLPKPVLDADTATYPDALPGMDVVVQLTATGFQQHTILKTRPSAPVSLTVPLTLNGLTARRGLGDSAEFVNAAGTVVAVMAGPSMWGAQLDAVSQQPAKTAPVAYTLTPKSYGVDVTLTPDLAFLTDPATQYPVTIDPDINFKGTFDTFVRQNTTTDGSASTDLGVGVDSSGNPARAFLNWDPAVIRGKQIVEAHLGLWNSYSSTCADRALDVYSADLATVATRWIYSGSGTHGQPAIAATKSGSTSGSKGQVACAQGYINTTPHALDALVQGWANTTSGEVGMALKAASETDISYYKGIRSGENVSGKPFMYVTYNSYPTIGMRQTNPSTTCATGTSRPYLNTTQPTLKAAISDAEGASVTAKFDWSAVGGSTAIGSATAGPGASGSWLSTAVPAGALSDGGSYGWRVQGYDGSGWGPWSAPCEFTADTVAPGTAPVVSSTTYPENQWAGGVNTTGAFTFGASGVSDVAAYEYGLDANPPNETVNASALGGTAGVSITPASDGPHTLYVRSRDRAGNQSSIKQYAVLVGAGGLTSPKIGDITADQTAITSVGKASAAGVTYQWRRGDADTWTTIPAADVTQAVGGAAVTWPLAGAGGQFPKLNWNVAQTLNAAEAGPDPLSGPLQVRAQFADGAVSSGVGISLDRNLASAESADAGPGSVNLVTGDLTVSDTDVSVDAYGSDLTVSRSFHTRRSADTDSAAMFGPGWVSGVVVGAAGAEYTELDVVGSLAQVVGSDGTTIGFAKRSATAFTPEIGAEDLKLSYTATGDSYALGDLDGDVTTFTRVAGAPAGHYFPTKVTMPGSDQTSTISWEKVTVSGTDRVRPTRMLAPVADGVSCTTLARGCRALTFTYATATSGGDFLGRAKEISFTAWDPDLTTPAMRTVAIARYTYDAAGRLASTWDPRRDWTDTNGLHHLADTYAYDADGILDTVTPSAQEPWHLGYTTVPGDSGKGRLAAVNRSALTAGTATTTVVYNVPVTGAGAPYDLSGTQTARWAQSEAPVRATAVFPASQIPSGNQSSGTLPGSYERATLTYLDANQRRVDTAVPGGYLSATTYDQYGNQIRELTAANRQQALDSALNDTPDAEATIARNLSTLNVYSFDGQQLLSTYGPEHDVMLPAATVVRGRGHTENTYDEGAPTTGAPYNLVTTKIDDVHYWGTDGAEHAADPRTTKTQYDWNLRQATATIVDPAGLNYKTRTNYDPVTGLETSSTAPAGGSVDTTPSTRRTVYYRASSGSGYAECDLRPEWANLACRVEVGGQAATGPEIPAKVTTYDIFDQPRVVIEKVATGTLRTTTTTYDAAGRELETAISAPNMGTAVPTRRSVYEPSTGRLTAIQSISGGQVTATDSQQYDSLNRRINYTDADGNQSATTYDLLGRIATATDGKATRTYTYDGGTERRGLLTSVADSQVGPFTATYDAGGRISAESWPDGVTATTSTDETGAGVQLAYRLTACTTDCTLYSESVLASTHGQWLSHQSSLSQQLYTYDQAGRLTAVADTVGNQCTTRSYGFDTAGNRTSLKDYAPAADGSCQTSTLLATDLSTYDTADRVSTSGYVYDALARITTVPAADTANVAGDNLTVTYHSTDVVDTITQNGRTTDYTLDVGGERIRSWTDTASGTAVTATNHYDGDGDSPVWTQEGASRYTRVVSGISGMAAVWDSAAAVPDWQLKNLHGDVVATIHGSDAGLSTTGEADEYGNPRNSSDVGTVRYGWLGTRQRAADTPSGLVLMGVRLYNTVTGRFLQTDPVAGGSCSAYDYACAAPLNNFDIDGKRCSRWVRWACRKAHGYFHRLRFYARYAWSSGDCRHAQCVHGSPHHYRVMREQSHRFVHWYCGLGPRTRWAINAAGFGLGFLVATLPYAFAILIMEAVCAFR